MIDLTQEAVQRIFYYDELTGMLLWRNGNGRNVKPWQQAKSPNGHGYFNVKICGRSYLVHKVIWLYVHGEWATQDIDHKNRVRNDNRICNLRLVSRTDNCQNIDPPAHNKSGHVGVSWMKSRKAWTVYVKINKKNKWLGCFKNIEDAVAARKAGEKQYYNLPDDVTWIQ